MKLWDFLCENCGRIVEYLQKNEADIPYCCGKPMVRLFTRCNFARFRSGDREKPIVKPDGTELDLKKEDIFGRRWDDLPDSHGKTHYYWKKIEEYEDIHREPAPLEYKEHLINKLFGKEIKESFQEGGKTDYGDLGET